MTTEYSVSVDDWRDESWTFTSRDILMDEIGEWADDNQEGLNEDACYPMMNYAYPLYDEPSRQAIIKIHEETNCCVVEKEGDFFLALTGGGMDLSQDIALAYLIAEGSIPFALALAVSTQEGLSKYGKKWLKIMRGCKKSIQNELRNGRYRIKRITEVMKEYKLKNKEVVA